MRKLLAYLMTTSWPSKVLITTRNRIGQRFSVICRSSGDTHLDLLNWLNGDPSDIGGTMPFRKLYRANR